MVAESTFRTNLLGANKKTNEVPPASTDAFACCQDNAGRLQRSAPKGLLAQTVYGGCVWRTGVFHTRILAKFETSCSTRIRSRHDPRFSYSRKEFLF